MARPQKPTLVKDITGAHKKNPKRKPKSEVRPRAGIGPAPVSPSSEFAAVWDEIVGMICPGVAGNSDRLALEILAHLVCEFRRAPTEMTGMKLARIEALMARFGLTPVDRQKIKAPEDDKPEKPEDKYF